MNRLSSPQSFRPLAWILLAASLAPLTACEIVGPASDPTEAPASTATFRTEFELIPDSQLVKVDTQPVWPLGSYAFEPGVDTLLVVSRITQVAVDPTEEEVAMGTYRQVRDKTVERVWITVPSGTTIGEELDLAELEYRFLAGYDAGPIGKPAFIQPARLTGRMKVLEIGEGTAKVWMEMKISPRDRPRWGASGQIETPITPTGKWAKSVLESDAARAVRVSFDADAPAPVQAEPVGGGGDDGGAATEAGTDVEAATDADVDADAGAGEEADVEAAPAPGSFLGKWEIRGRRATYRFQFTRDGQVVAAVTREGGGAAAMHYGGFTIRDGVILVRWDRLITDRDILDADRRVGSLRWGMEGEQLMLSGRLYLRNDLVDPFRITLNPADFPDMRYFRAPDGEGERDFDRNDRLQP